VPPDVTAGDEELEVGEEEPEEVDEVPVFPVLPVLPVVPVFPDVPVVPDVALEPVDAVLVLVVEAGFAALEPGRSWATTMPMAAVAPATATTAPRVRARRRDMARSLSAGVLCWPGADMGGVPCSGTTQWEHARFEPDAEPPVVLL
jgi:hypothetical protein